MTCRKRLYNINQSMRKLHKTRCLPQFKFNNLTLFTQSFNRILLYIFFLYLTQLKEGTTIEQFDQKSGYLNALRSSMIDVILNYVCH